MMAENFEDADRLSAGGGSHRQEAAIRFLERMRHVGARVLPSEGYAASQGPGVGNVNGMVATGDAVPRDLLILSELHSVAG